jgi:phosphoserine phosphatase RsbU/P
MTVRRRLMLLVTLLIAASVLSTAGVFAVISWRTMVAQTKQDSLLLARLLAQTVSVAQQAPLTVEEVAAEGMAGQADLVARLVAQAQRNGLGAADVGDTLRTVAARNGLGEIWVTDRQGRPLLSSLDDLDARLGEDDPLLRSESFAALRRGERARMTLSPAYRAADRRNLIIGGAALDDGDGMAVVMQDAARLAQAGDRIGIYRLLEAVMARSPIDALWVLDAGGAAQAQVSRQGGRDGAAPDGEAEAVMRRVSASSLAEMTLDGDFWGFLMGRPGRLLAASPVLDHDGLPNGLAALSLPTTKLQEAVRTLALYAGGLTAALLLAGVGFTWLVAYFISQPIGRVTQAATDMEALRFTPGMLDDVAGRGDELGRLARVFQSMAREVLAREEHLEGLVRARTQELQSKNELLEAAQKQMEEELRAAQSLQAAILPQVFPDVSTHQCKALMDPALQLGGDFYDLFALDDDHLAVAIADVSGKGVRAAFFMAISRTILQNAGKENRSPGEALRVANDQLCQVNPMTMFVTVFYGVLNVRTGLFRYANGGHNPPHVVQGADGAVRRIPPTGGMALGIMEEMDYAESEVQLTPGDTVFLYTDGVSEAMNVDGDEYTEQRLMEVLNASQRLPLDNLLQKVRAEVQAFAGAAPQSDDLTCLALRYIPGTVEQDEAA